MKFIIEKDAAQALLEYLVKQPFEEVFRLIPLLTGLRPLPEPEPDSEPMEMKSE